MNAQLPSTRRSSLDSFVLNAVTLVAWWVMLTLWIRTWFPNGLGIKPGEWRIGEITILAACLLGAFAALTESRVGGFGGERVWDARKVGTSLLRAGLTIRRNLGSWAHLALGIIAFATAEAAIRLYFASWLKMNGLGWRWRHLFLDGKTNYAILCCALLGAALGMMIARWGGRLAISMPGNKPAAESISA